MGKSIWTPYTVCLNGRRAGHFLLPIFTEVFCRINFKLKTNCNLLNFVSCDLHLETSKRLVEIRQRLPAPWFLGHIVLILPYCIECPSQIEIYIFVYLKLILSMSAYILLPQAIWPRIMEYICPVYSVDIFSQLKCSPASGSLS